MSRKKNIKTDNTDDTHADALAKADSADDAEFNADDAATDDKEFTTEPLVEAEDVQADKTGGKRKSGGGFISWLALLLSCVALAAFAYGFIVDRGASADSAANDGELSELANSLETTQRALTSLEQQVSSSRGNDAAGASQLESQLNSLGRQVDDRLRQMEALPGRLATVEASLASVQGISAGARTTWLLAEAEYYMQIANAQMQLANNPALAATALAYADERIVQLGDPRLTNVRQALSDELRSLESMQTADTAGITLTLASLAKAVEGLPLRRETVIRADAVDDSSSAELSGIERALASMKSSFSKAVTVRRADEAMQPLIAPEALYFLRTNVALQLQIARLALLRGEETIFQRSLDDIDAWLAQYYDLTDSGVRNARATLREVRSSTVTVAAPDISRSLRLLRQFNALNPVVRERAAIDSNPRAASERSAVDSTPVADTERSAVDNTPIADAERSAVDNTPAIDTETSAVDNTPAVDTETSVVDNNPPADTEADDEPEQNQ